MCCTVLRSNCKPDKRKEKRMMNFNIQLFADNLQNTTATMSKEMKTF